MAKDKSNGKEHKAPAIPDEIKQLLAVAARPPQKIEIKEDARASTLAVMAETIAVGFQVVGMLANHVTTAPHYPTTESRQ